MNKKATPKRQPQALTYTSRGHLGHWRGYRAWAEHLSEFTRYTQELEDGPSHYWPALMAMEQDSAVLTYPLVDVHIHNLLAVQRPIVGPPLLEAPRHLYVLDVDDLGDFTTDDVLMAWSFRGQCCGSIEAASELYALYRVLNGDDETYAGPAAYLDDPAVLAMFAVPGSKEQAVQGSSSIPRAGSEREFLPGDGDFQDSPAGLTLADVRTLTAEPLRAAWANRPESFASLEAAAETLAILRSLNFADPVKPTFKSMMDHDLIQDLLDTLPLELSPAAPAPAVELEYLRADQRQVRSQATVVRPRQGNFRASLLQRYGGACCITGCKVDTLLEAAHIIPYRGDQSDDVSNGLLLRVDLHRLFDAHLVTIHPRTFTVEVASAIEDAEYRAFHGKTLFTFSPKPRVLFLETHYAAFVKAARANP
ncbi:HNH endonuclease [Pseudomonas mosselii]|uniref:HNH endonuclease n=1 Tax=Pseudomonas mosselii TaxID=78327 RepID=UPI0021D878DF|nr:HNH endonuclease [Pseudomonas mosselii]MCU9527530.1 HNH endonuclease [Pseudomonas mosselii]MCU9534843.1 HNH endonuclease [Pseudomonas mosselii]MCU9542777.1 HNH endonuclease [Pseudomonas mosselii]MCU9546683.1 HNH endonuclease [Pseudomonas mosselii]